MSAQCLRRLSTFAHWPLPRGACSGITNFATKAAAAHLERSAECDEDEVMCMSCGLKYKDWKNESPAAVHRAISPKCPALNPTSLDHQQGNGGDVRDLRSLQQNPFLKYLPDYIQERVSALNEENEENPEIPASTPQHDGTVYEAAFRTPGETQTHSALTTACERPRVRRALFPNEETHRPNHQQTESTDEVGYHNSENSYSTQSTSPSVLQLLSQSPVTHPFKTKFGDYDFLFASRRLQTYPPPVNSKKYSTYAEAGFAFRNVQKDVICVYCGTVLVLNGHQPFVAHEKACPTCPFVMGFDVGNISQQQEKDIRLKYFMQQAANKRHENDSLDFIIKYPQYMKDCDRKGSFQSWPTPCERMFPSDGMVSAGLYYSGHSDKVVCYCCGVEFADWQEDTDVWKTHAAVSPTCLHVINKKGQDFIDQAANTEVLVEVQFPSGSNKYSGTSQKSLSGGLPGSSQLDTAIQAALARGYTLPQIQHAIVKFFSRTSRFPNEAILNAIMKGDSEYHSTVCKQQQLVLEQGTVIQQKDTQLQQKDTQLQQKDTQLQQKDTQLQEQGTQLQRTVQVYQQQLAEKDEQLTIQGEQLTIKDEQLTIQGEQLTDKDEQLTTLNQQLQLQDQQIQSLMRQVQQLRADRHRNMDNPVGGAQGNEQQLNNLRASNEELRQRMTCKICESDKPRMIFLPCGHLYCCAECTSRLLPDSRCPVCRQDISDILPAFVA